MPAPGKQAVPITACTRTLAEWIADDDSSPTNQAPANRTPAERTFHARFASTLTTFEDGERLSAPHQLALPPLG